jgi:predicted RNase H-like HicB family nuclease
MTVNELPRYTYRWIKSAESGDFEARCLEIPDLSAYGETPEEALSEIKVAVCGWLEVLEKDGLPLPAPQYLMTHKQGLTSVS